MFIVRVVPISRGIFAEELTFFSREAVPPGSVVSASVRKKIVPALVISSTDARGERADIRSAAFALKKIEPKNAKRLFTRAFIEAVRDTALWHGAHESVFLSTLTPSAILSSPQKLETTRDSEGLPEERPRSDLLVLQAEKEERVRTYRNLARECFARGASLLILTSSVIEAEILARELERGIEEQVILFTNDLPKKKLIDAWNRAANDPEPLLIIGTASALSLPRRDLDTIAVERESARSWRGVARPRADYRRAAEAIARKTGARFILADFPLRVETRFRVESGEFEELARAQWRPSGNADVRIIDTRKKDETKALSQKTKRVFSTLSDETLFRIREELARGGRAAVFAARRGIAPLTVCNDCGTPVSDAETGTPMSLHRTATGNVFLSHRSGAILPAGTPCQHCGSWNLVTLGIGVERVEEELKKHFPDAPIILFTKETAPAHASAKKLSERFFSAPGSIIVGTERMLPYLVEPVELSIAASVDSMLSLSAWRAHEHTLSILFYLRERSELSFIVETRKPEHLVMQTIRSGNPAEFYRADIEERKRYGYPPFSVFIGLEWAGARAAVEKERSAIKEYFADLDLVGPLPALVSAKNEWVARAVLRIPKEKWPDEALAKRLRALPPGVAVTIDPDDIA